MKRLLLVMLTAFSLLQLACYKDKGNYDYHPAVQPGITNLDTLYRVRVGDTLIIKPVLTTTDPKARFGLTWRVSQPLKVKDTTFYGDTFKYIFLLDPDTYPVRLTITDSSNGMQYFYNFKIQGVTPWSVGTLVLSQENNTSQLSFVQTDNTVLPRIYKTLNRVDLPGKPQQLIDLIKQNVNPVPALGYWITNDDAIDGGTRIGTNTLVKTGTLRTNFFDMPPAAKAGHLETTDNGVLRGVINGKAYEGAWQTYYGFDNIYGYLGEPVTGDYELFPRIVWNQAMPLIVMGYEKNLKQFVGFTNLGGLAYIGTGYQVTSTAAFDPAKANLDLLYLHQIGAGSIYAFGKAADGTLYDLKFVTAFKGYVEVTPVYKQAFPQPALITPTTKWAGALNNGEVFYFTSGDKIYSYTPGNKQITALNTNFGGKNVTMLKITDGDNTLIAGVDGAVYFLDVSTGVNGNVIKKIDGIPGSPIDVVVKK